MAIKPWTEDFATGFQFSGIYSSIPLGQLATRQEVALAIIHATDGAGGIAPDYMVVNPTQWWGLAKDFNIGGTRMQALKVLGVDVLPFRPA